MTISSESQDPFVLDVRAIRDRAREHIERGAVTDAYGADVDTVVRVLNEVLATWPPRSCAGCATSGTRRSRPRWAASRERRSRASSSSTRAKSKSTRSRSHSTHAAGNSLREMLAEDLVAERIAIESYAEIIRYLGQRDPTSRRMMEDILAMEEEHADELSDWLERVG